MRARRRLAGPSSSRSSPLIRRAPHNHHRPLLQVLFDQYWSPDRARSRDIGSIKNILLTSGTDLILERPDESAFELKRFQMLSAGSVGQ